MDTEQFSTVEYYWVTNAHTLCDRNSNISQRKQSLGKGRKAMVVIGGREGERRGKQKQLSMIRYW